MIPRTGGVARETPVGVGGVKRRGSTKRPAVVEEFMALEREHGIEELVKMIEAQEEGATKSRLRQTRSRTRLLAIAEK